MYISQLTQSGQLLGHLDENWHRFKEVATPAFMDTIQAFQDYNVSATHKEEAGLCRDICASLLSKFKRWVDIQIKQIFKSNFMYFLIG